MNFQWFSVSISDSLSIIRTQFWQAIWIWNLKSNIVNRRLFGVQILHSFILEPNSKIDNVTDLVRDALSDTSVNWDAEKVVDYLKQKFVLQTCSEDDTRLFSDKSFVVLKKVFFRNRNCSDLLEVCVINYGQNEILHYPIGFSIRNECFDSSIFPLRIRFIDDRIEIQAVRNSENSITTNWIEYLLLPKLCKWAEEMDPADGFHPNKTTSLKLVPVDEYKKLYSCWKEKYGKQLVENWTENTDPLKYVFEDIAIAAYLSLLWCNKKVNFVDLGCGNGLLVHILTEEGHKGRGVDVRSRKIWSLYPSSTTLEIGSVTPEENSHHPDADWIIGNHSDELTPWIPVFAARNSYTCNFFLLPCCAYELSGQRYQRKNSSVSVYNDYMEYIKKLTTQLGFEVKVDRLRIPSTKRICFVGDKRTYLRSSYEHMLKERLNLLNIPNVRDFTPRESVEKVRNCTKIDRSIASRICDTISATLIQKQLNMKEANPSCDIWAEDYSVSFAEAVSLLGSENLKELKNECGGLQTLLRNNHSVYLIREGRIYFRKPSEKSISSNWKKRHCWFFHHHPWGCPLPENKCAFSH